MAGQRRRERSGDRRRGAGRLGRLGGGLVCAGLIACAPQPTEPDLVPGLPLPPAAEPGPHPPPPAASSPLIGTWRGVNTAFLPSHVQTTTWHFSPDGSCLQTFLTIADGVELTSTRACTWTADAATVTVTYAGAAGPVTFTLRYSFPASDRLRLDANEYARVD